MKTILIFSVVVTAIVADVHELHNAYHYDKPITSYGVPSFTVDNKYSTGFSTSKVFSGGATTGNSGLNAGFANGVGTVTGIPDVVTSGGFNTGYVTGSGSGFTSGSGSGFTSGSNSGSKGNSNTSGQSSNGGYTFGGSTNQNGNGYTVTGSSGQSINSGVTSAGSTGGFQGLSSQQGSQYQTGYQTTGQQSNLNYHTTGQSGHYQQQYNFVQSGPPQIFKHFYVHVAPEEPEPVKQQKPIVLPPKQKHYNIIFVKTPTPAAGSSQVIPIQQESEEKTIVYVLVQKPEDINDVVLPKFTPKQPSKPEVFFIKYDGKDNAHGVINNIVNDYQNHDSVTFNGIGVSSDELSGKNVIIHDKQAGSNKYETPISGGFSSQQVSISGNSDSSNNNFVSSTESHNLGSSNIGISSIGSNEVVSSTPEYSGTGSSLFSSTSGLGGFGTGNEVKIGSSYVGPTVTESTGSSGSKFGSTAGKFQFTTSGKGDSSGGKFGGSNNYQSVQIETSSIGTTSKGSDGFGFGGFQTSSIRPSQSSSVGPSSTLNSIVTGNSIGSSTPSSLGNNLNSISTSLSVPFETYGPPSFKP